MSEIQSLITLRAKLVARRRKLVESLAGTPVEELSGTSITHIQEGIDAVDRALEDEKNAGPNAEDSRRRVL
jgi:hypothetical protein